jgi:hypothetical protein
MRTPAKRITDLAIKKGAAAAGKNISKDSGQTAGRIWLSQQEHQQQVQYSTYISVCGFQETA